MINGKMKIGILIGLVIALAMTICCSPHDNASKTLAQMIEATEVTPGLWLIKSGPCLTSDAWQKALPNFIQKHPELQIVAIHYASSAQCAGDEETFLVTIPKNICPIKP